MGKLALLTGPLCCAASLALAGPTPVSPSLSDCRTLAACLRQLDAIAPTHKSGAGSPSLDAEMAGRLESFGVPAKREVLKRAAGDDKDWRELAGWLLMYWTSFDVSDVPDLVKALHADPGGGAAKPLGRIGTREAIDAIVEDVRLHGAANQSGFALSQLGDRGFPYLLPLLADDKRWRDAATILHDMKPDATHALNQWVAIALDPKQSEQNRVGALRGIGVLGSSAKSVAPQLRSLPYDRNFNELLPKVLMAMGDASAAKVAILSCGRSKDPYWSDFGTDVCLSRAAAYGDAARPYANWLLSTFADSENGGDRADAASAVGFIGYREASGRLIEMLHDPDWHAVYAAARALGWSGAKEALPTLQDVAKTHWLADVRAAAEVAVNALNTETGFLARPKLEPGTLGSPPSVDDFSIDATNAPDIKPCDSNVWSWKGRTFRGPGHAKMNLALAARGVMPAGTVTGSDNGEWGGELVWHPSNGASQYLYSGNVEGIEAAGAGFIAVFGCGGTYRSYDPNVPKSIDKSIETITISNGPSGSGIALLAVPDSSGAWRVHKIAEFPRAVDDLTTIGDDVYAAWSGNRAIVFSSKGVSGTAECTVVK